VIRNLCLSVSLTLFAIGALAAQAGNDNPPIWSVPVFQPGKSASFNSLIATDRSISIENNYGYLGLSTTTVGPATEPRSTRIDIDDDRNGCHTVWTNNEERVPNVVSQASLPTGLEYTYLGPDGKTAYVGVVAGLVRIHDTY
jgi:hypothetical protein